MLSLPNGLLLVAAIGLAGWFSAAAADPLPGGPPGAPSTDAPRAGVIVFGGTRGTGLEVVRLLVDGGEQVTVVVRPTSDTAALRALGVKTVVADALDAPALAAALAGTRFAAAVSTLGTSRGDKDKRPDFLGNRNAIEAAKAAGIRRFLLVTTIGAGNSQQTAPWLARRFLGEVMTLKTQAEEHLEASGLDYTIVRPGGLLDKPPSRRATLTEDPTAFSWIARADLARLVVDALYDPQTHGRTYHAYDPTRTGFTSVWRD